MNARWLPLSVAVWPARALAEPVGSGAYLNLVLSLVLILAGFVAVAWLGRRWLPGRAPQGVVRVVGATPVGARERVVVVEVADTWVVLGVGGGQVRALHHLPRPEKTPEGGA